MSTTLDAAERVRRIYMRQLTWRRWYELCDRLGVRVIEVGDGHATTLAPPGVKAPPPPLPMR